MTPQRHQRIMELFNAAVEQPADARAAWLAEACGDDAELRVEVESLLAHDFSAGGLDRPPLGAAVAWSEFADARPADLPVPERIDKFEILSVLGSGGMGVVYRARQQQPARIVALKLIRSDLATPASRRRFQTEMETLARLRHPGIAAIYEGGTLVTAAGEQPYIAMEYVEGTPLAEVMADGRLDQAARVALLARLCDAVEHAHRRGVIHRDLKPANILVEMVDGVAQPRVLDFGVARLTDRETRATTATAPGELLGTLTYMSPEQTDGDPNAIDTRSDVYSLGVIGYEMLCGQLPVDIPGTSVYSAIQAIRETPPKPLHLRDRTLHGDLNTIILKALAKDREQRYDSAAALAADLRRYLAHEPILGRPPTAWYLLSKYAARHRVVVGAAALALVGLALGAAAAGYGLVRARQAAGELAIELQQASDTVAFLAGDVATNLDAIAGTAEVRRRLLDRLIGQVDEVLRRRPGDERLLAAKARVLDQRGGLAVAESDYGLALALFEQALAIRERLAAANPDDAQLQTDLSIALVKVGDAYNDQHDFAAARPWYERALHIDEQMASLHPGPRQLDTLAWSYDRLGVLAVRAGRLDDAEQYIGLRREINERLLALDPDNPTTLHGLWETHDLLAGLAERRGDKETAIRETRAALECANRLVSREPHHRRYLLAQLCSQTCLGNLLVAQSPGEASTQLDVAIERGERLLELEPQDCVAQWWLGAALHRRATLAAAAGDAERAIGCLERALALYRAGCASTVEPSGIDLTQLEQELAQIRATTRSAPAAPAP